MERFIALVTPQWTVQGRTRRCEIHLLYIKLVNRGMEELGVVCDLNEQLRRRIQISCVIVRPQVEYSLVTH